MRPPVVVAGLAALIGLAVPAHADPVRAFWTRSRSTQGER
jgi:hypothetical protein